MRKTLLTLATVGALALSGCNSSSLTLTEEQLATIQALTQTACGFLPTAVTIANIASGSNPVVVPASEIAGAICAAVATQSVNRTAGVEKTAQVVVKINGKEVTVDVTGHFVR